MSHWTLDGCPSEDLVAAFVGGELEAEEHGSIEAHLDTCKPCRTVVADLVRMFADPNMPTLPSDGAVSLEGEPPGLAQVAVGASIGRYVIREVLGMGGMGVVYLAHDPELDRRVALKVIRRSGGRDAADQSARLLREARAMAKLSHPNVIAVHDVGTWSGQVFVAMEYAGGGTLAGWLKQAPRTWAGLARTLLAAGRGLAAAHEAGLVHRDFKPDNVLIGERGRVFVTDFGLARWGLAASEDATVDESSDSPDLEVLTRTGAFVGTPAYMAPEQFAGAEVGPACDQFAFCVVVWEALFGARPFEAKTIHALAAAVCQAPTPAMPATPAVPRRVRLALERGLSKRPEDRFPSMQALLHAIGPVRSTKAPWIVAGLLGAVALPLGVMALRPAPVPAAADCSHLAGLQAWDQGRAAAVQAAFEATGERTAAGIAEEVHARLDAYAQRWAAQEQALCQATLDPDRAALRHQCLDRSRTVLTQVVEGFTHADADVVRRATKAVANLPNLESCSDDAQLMAEKPPAPPEAIADRVQAVRDALTAADAELSIGRYTEGLALIDAQQDETAALGFRPLRAEVAYARGRMLANVGRHADAEQALDEAELHAMATRYTTLLARALILRIYAMALQRAEWSAVQPVLARAEAALDGTTLPPQIRGTLYTNASIAAFYARDLEGAATLAEKALSLTDRDVDPLRWASAAQAQLIARRSLGEAEGAEPRLMEIIEIYRRELGPLHPDLAEAHRDLANVYRAREQFDDARTEANRALALIETIFGPDHFEYGGTLSTLSGIEGAAGRYTEALAYAERSAEVLGAAGMSTQIPRGQQVEWLIALDRPDEAEPVLEALIAEEIERRGDGPNVAWMLFIRCALEAARHDVDATRRACDDAIETSGVLPRDALMLEMQLDRAEYLAKAGAPEEARASLEAHRDEATALEASPTRARFFEVLGGLETPSPL